MTIGRRSVVKAGLATLFLPLVGRRVSGGSLLPTLEPGADLQAALDALGGKGTLELAAGDFLLPDTLRVDGAIEIRGAGQNSTRLIYHGDGVAIQINDSGTINTRNWLIRDLTVDGESEGLIGVSVGQTGSGWKGANTGGMQNCCVSGFVDAGIHLVKGGINRFRQVDASYNPGHGLKIASPDGKGINDTSFIGCFFRYNQRCGIYAQHGGHISFRNCICELNGEEGVWLHKPLANFSTASWLFEHFCCTDNNHNRLGKDWAQFKLSNDEVGSTWGDLRLIQPLFSQAGSGNDHIQMGTAIAEIVRPSVYDPDRLGRDTEPGLNLLIRSWELGLGWYLLDGSSSVTRLVESGEYPHTVFVNNGLGQWVLWDGGG